MPVMDRLEAIRQIRADPSLRSAVVIALSAGVLDTEVDEAMAAGFDDYLPKPIDFDALTEMLGEITGSETFTIKPQDDFYVRGVNFGNAINSHGGDVQFLITLTSDFINIYGNADSQIAGFLAERDIEQAERLIHNIAGISGTFGAEDLMETCRKVEREIERTHRSLNQITKSFELNWKTLFPPSRNFSRATQATGGPISLPGPAPSPVCLQACQSQTTLYPPDVMARHRSWRGISIRGDLDAAHPSSATFP